MKQISGFKSIVQNNIPAKMQEKKTFNKRSPSSSPFFSVCSNTQPEGKLEFNSLSGNQSGTARPLFSNISNPPLDGEVILIFPCVNSPYNNSQSSEIFNSSIIYFYISNINYWNNPGCNNVIAPNSEGEQIANVPQKILTPNRGDVIIQGRFNNSIRLGSTITPPSSETSPLITISNGRERGNEDIKLDKSSIFLSSTQSFPTFSLINENFKSYKNNPQTPASYNKPQIILNSSRISLNAIHSDIFISANKSIGISSNDSINIESTKNTIIDGHVLIGNKSADEPALLGNETIILLKQLITEVRNISLALETNQVFPAGATAPDGTSLSVAGSAVNICNKLLEQINPKTGKPKILSNKVKISR
mgnify:CR=1 FL=1|jgi:hypothetical protein|tara:strand:+ start:5151 stop:6239 length:1089 start_codon:yes stop_codon:yes gene_type:complete